MGIPEEKEQVIYVKARDAEKYLKVTVHSPDCTVSVEQTDEVVSTSITSIQLLTKKFASTHPDENVRKAVQKCDNSGRIVFFKFNPELPVCILTRSQREKWKEYDPSIDMKPMAKYYAVAPELNAKTLKSTPFFAQFSALSLDEKKALLRALIELI